MAVTSATELSTVVGIVEKLRSLLDLAKTVKPKNTIDPALPVADFIDGVHALSEGVSEDSDQVYRFSLVETATREVFYSLLRSFEIDDPSFVEVWNLLDIVLICGDHAVCTPELVCWLLEELLDSQTTSGCRKVFDYLELRRERLAQKDFHKKNLVFLRSCNELLRRLSRAEDAIFCGRVFFFLFQTFPLGDKSSVNLRGEFHVDNNTVFDEKTPRTDEEDDEQVDINMETHQEPSTSSVGNAPAAASSLTRAESKALNTKPTPKNAVEEEALPNYELYPIFWRLQHDFSNPTRLYESENFSAFKHGLQSTITKFKNSPTVVQTKVEETGRKGNKRRLDEDESDHGSTDHLVDNYNPKYLTSRDLFHLELSDLAFQRHILVQALILIDFLLSLTETAKKKRDALAFPNKALLYMYTLSDEDATWTISTRATITSYLGSTREGREYCRMVETVLARDKNWVRWKMESCPSIVRGPVSTKQELAARKSIQEVTRPRRVPDKPMGAMNLSFLDEGVGGGLQALKNPTRHELTSVETLINGIKNDQLDADMADDEEKARLHNAIANKKWRALRRARATNLILLNKVESTKDLDFDAAIPSHDSAVAAIVMDQTADEATPTSTVADATGVAVDA